MLGYIYPFYRSPFMFGSYPFTYGYGSGFGYGGYGGFGSNIIGSAVANQSLINTGSITGVNQIATPTVIW